MSSVIVYLKGVCMGAADVVPGVSGGTMALILGIYQTLINAIKSFDYLWFKSIVTLDIKTVFKRPHFLFIIPLFLGIISAIVFFTRVVPLPVYIKTHPEQVYGLFFGLILASIYILLKEVKLNHFTNFLAILLGVLAGMSVFHLVPTETPNDSWFIMLSGAVAICAMILPGISGSFILLMLKKYAYVLHAIGHFQLSVILPFAFGAAIGLMLFSRVLSYLLNRFYKNTLLLIVGILIASLWIIWPFQERIYQSMRGKEYLIKSTPILPEQFSQNVMLSLFFFIVGFVVVLVIDWLAGKVE